MATVFYFKEQSLMTNAIKGLRYVQERCGTVFFFVLCFMYNFNNSVDLFDCAMVLPESKLVAWDQVFSSINTISRPRNSLSKSFNNIGSRLIGRSIQQIRDFFQVSGSFSFLQPSIVWENVFLADTR